MVFWVLCGLFLDSPCCRSVCYDNNRATERTCPCKPLLTLSIIAVRRKLHRAADQISELLNRTLASLRLLLLLLLGFSSSALPLPLHGAASRPDTCSAVLLPAAAE